MDWTHLCTPRKKWRNLGKTHGHFINHHLLKSLKSHRQTKSYYTRNFFKDITFIIITHLLIYHLHKLHIYTWQGTPQNLRYGFMHCYKIQSSFYFLFFAGYRRRRFFHNFITKKPSNCSDATENKILRHTFTLYRRTKTSTGKQS